MTINFEAIGYLFTPFEKIEDMPIQPSGKNTRAGRAEVKPEFAGGLKDLEMFSHVILIYFFHRQTKTRLLVKPFLDETSHGIFATRAPARPNPIGLSVVPLIKIEKDTLFLDHLDMLNKTPLLDIKPLVPGFDFYEIVSAGWLEGKAGLRNRNADGRFT